MRVRFIKLLLPLRSCVGAGNFDALRLHVLLTPVADKGDKTKSPGSCLHAG